MTPHRGKGASIVCGCWLLAWLMSSPEAGADVGPRFPESVALSTQDIHEAVMRGRTGHVEPYVLSRSLGGPATKVAVYTPFIRVALATRAGVLTFDGVRLQTKAGDDWIASPEVLVVIASPDPRQTGSEQDTSADELRAAGPLRLYISRHINPSPAAIAPDAKPLRVLALDSLQWLGTIPFERPSVAATFGSQNFRDGSIIAAEWGRRYGVMFLTGGYLRHEELAGWR